MAMFMQRDFDQPLILQASLDTINPYLVIGSPRSGSTFFASMMYEIAGYGVPVEYFNKGINIAGRFGAITSRGKVKRIDTDAYLSALFANRTTERNNAFGMKLFPRHFEWMMQATHGPALLAKSKIVRIVRADKVSQAISFYISKKTGQWNSDEPPTPEKLEGVKYRYRPILASLRTFQSHEMFWNLVEHKYGLKPFNIVYEDLIANKTAIGRQVMEYLTGSPCTLDFTQDTTPKKQGTDLNRKFKEKFLKDFDFSKPASITAVLRG